MPVDLCVIVVPALVLLLLLAAIFVPATSRNKTVRPRRWVLSWTGALAVLFLLAYVVPGWLWMAGSAAGSMEARYRLGCWYFERFGYNWPNHEKGWECLVSAAEGGHADAQCWLGLQHLYGSTMGMKKGSRDLEQAEFWFSKAAVSAKRTDRWGNPQEHLREVRAMIKAGEH